MRLTKEQLAGLGYDDHGNRIQQSDADAFARERDLHDYIIDRCRDLGYYVIHSRMDRRSTVAVGAPDFVVAMPHGRTVWIECKSATGKPTRAQCSNITQLLHLGHVVHIVRSQKEADSALEKQP